jgi:hypothetical protein
MLQSGFHGWQHRIVQRSGGQEPAHARMRKDSDSEARTAAAARGRGLPVWVESAGWMGRTHVEC